MKIEHDKQADAIYIYFTDTDYAYGKDLDHERRIDYSADGKPRGIELTCVSRGVNIDDLPFAGEVEILLRDENIRIFA